MHTGGACQALELFVKIKAVLNSVLFGAERRQENEEFLSGVRISSGFGIFIFSFDACFIMHL